MKLITPITRTLGLTFAILQVSVALYATPARAQAQAPVQRQTMGAGPIDLTAKSANVAEAGTPVKISILRWSTDEERKPVVEALDPAAKPAAAGRGGGEGRGGRGGGAQLDPNDPTLAGLDGQPARGGRGGRGGRGDAAPAAPPDPISTLTGAIGKATTVGYLWTNETVGYSIKYAYRIPLPDGGERIILATDRPLGVGTVGWKPVATGTPTDYEFTLIEVRIDSKGLGEGKASLSSKVIFDNEAKTPVLDNYAATPAILQNVKR